MIGVRLAVALLIVSSLRAGELRVDINRDSKNSPSVTETNYVQWSTDSTNAAATGTAAVSRSFTTSTGENVTVTFAQTAASATAGGTGLLSNWYQTGAQGTAKLVSDGLTVAPANLATGGQLRMTITGLAAGAHTLLTYHNAWDALTAGSLGPIDVSVNGALVIDNLQPSIRAATNIASAIGYLNFSVSGPTDTAVFLFAADPTAGGATVTIRNAMINGFEIDTPNANRVAYNPSPADADEHVDADSGTVTLAWTPALAGDTASHDVYFGTDRATVKAAIRASGEYLGNQTAASTSVTVPNKNGAYYWRIDEIDTLGNITQGQVWFFRPRMLAFSGAEGHGRFARGGRGGRVIHVTSLADYITGETPIPGTLRYAVEVETGPRVIVFDVGGLITVRQRLTLASPYVTIAGQTAPGKGICLAEWPLGLSGSNDSVVRHIRNRPGNISGQTIDGGGLAGCNYSIMDHCSISWSIDEGFSSRSAKNITLQATLISEALNIAGHQNYPAGTAHGYAATIGGDKGSFHHNLLAHCEGRNWSMGGGLDSSGNFAGRLDIRNNVVYNWRNRTTDGGAHEVNFVNNYYKPGAATTLFTALNPTYDNFPGTQQYYMSGNVMPGRFDESNQAAGRTVAGSNGGSLPTTYDVWVAAPFFPSEVTTQTAVAAYKRVLSDVGTNRPRIDDHDLRVIQETLTGTYTYTGTGTYGGYPGLPNSQTDVGGWENYPADVRTTDWDTDGDGLPDWWERIQGTNTASTSGDFSDANADPDNNGYTRLDDYLAWMALPHIQAISGGTTDIDLTTLTRGYTLSPTYQVQLVAASISAGTVQLLGDGHTARLTASSSFTGLARFTYTVTDGQGDTLSGEIGVRVTASGTPPALIITQDSAGPALRFNGTEGLTYTIQHSTDLASWTNWMNIAASGAIQPITVPSELLPAPRRFFRAVR
jgi:hypothetical protein